MKISWLMVSLLAVGLLSGSSISPQRIARADDSLESLEKGNLFTFARVQFNSRGSFRRGGRRNPGWAHDYPRAERNFLNILAELTTIQTSHDSYEVVQLDDPVIMQYPFLYFSEPGTWEITPEEAENLREYFDRGGFAMFDDFQGRRDWQIFYANFQRFMPGKQLEQLTASDPIFRCFFEIENLDMQDPQTGEASVFYGMRDDQGRLQIIVNFNNDLGDYWEWSDEGLFPLSLSNEAYKYGVNYVVYALTH